MTHAVVVGLSLGLLLQLASCGGGGSSSVTFGLAQREIVTTLTFPIGVPTPTPLNAVEAFPFVSFQSPVGLTHLGDGTDRICVVEQAGEIEIFPNDPSVTSTTTFLDIKGRVNSGGEEGLLGLAFPPDHDVSGFFYVYYSAASPRRTVLSRFQVTADPNLADAGSESILLEVLQPFANHNAGQLAFGPDGYLYLSLGDGGSGGDPFNNAQDLTTLLGSLLRIQPEPGGGYSIPADNPFVGLGGGVREEAWAYGLRNPWRFSFDRVTGDLWLGDVGQNAREEVNLVEEGDNLGWRLFEGTAPFDNPMGLPPSQFKEPVIDYPHSQGVSVTGGYVYRGPTLTTFEGVYFYGDYASGRVWALVYDGTDVLSNTEVSNVSSLTSFGEDEAGELYAVSHGGDIYRFEPSGPVTPPPFPTLLSQTGIFQDLATLQVEPGIIEYDVNAPFWSDNALKRRWIALPGTSRIDFHPTDAWDFPTGTVLIKHFEIELSVGDPDSAVRLETRVLVNELGAGWSGYTYRWNGAGTEATLLTDAEDEILVINDPAAPGGQRDQMWHYPSSTECDSCHTAPAGRILGVRTRQLNGDFPYPALVDNQLRSWNHIGLFTTDVGIPGVFESYVDPADEMANLDDRARVYLEVNCAQCHQPGAVPTVDIDLRYDVALGDMGVVGVPPVAGDVGLPSPFIVDAGNKEGSVLWERMRLLDSFRMPPLGSHLVDDPGVDLIGVWIDGL